MAAARASVDASTGDFASAADAAWSASQRSASIAASTTVAGRRDRLAVPMVMDVAGHEHAFDPGAGMVVDLEVTLLVDVEPVPEDLAVGLVADGHEQPFSRHRPLGAGDGVAQAQALDVGVADDLLDGGIGVDLDLGVVDRPLDHDPAAAELVPAVEQVDPGREPGQEGGLLEGRVATADDRDLLVPEEEPIARRAGADATTAQPGLAVQTEPDRAGAGGHDDRLGAVLDAPRPEPERPLREVDPVDVDVDDVRAEPLGLRAEGGHQVGTLDPIREARVVLDIAGDHQLATRGGSGQDDRSEVRSSGVDRGGESGRAGTDDDHAGLRPTVVGAVQGRAAGAGRGFGYDRLRGEFDRRDRRGERDGFGISAEVDRQPAEGAGRDVGVGSRSGGSWSVGSGGRRSSLPSYHVVDTPGEYKAGTLRAITGCAAEGSRRARSVRVGQDRPGRGRSR